MLPVGESVAAMLMGRAHSPQAGEARTSSCCIKLPRHRLSQLLSQLLNQLLNRQLDRTA
jgi:hypothetical protein